MRQAPTIRIYNGLPPSKFTGDLWETQRQLGGLLRIRFIFSPACSRIPQAFIMFAFWRAGLAIAQSEKPDLVLMDLGLPGIDGWEAMRRIKASAETKYLPVIGLIAHAMAGDRERALEAGCDDYDANPIELERLIGKIESLLPNEAKGAPS
jgi:CheY-like chemotaxis protein